MDAFTIVGIVVGFGLWLALIFAVDRWGPFEDGLPIGRRARRGRDDR